MILGHMQQIEVSGNQGKWVTVLHCTAIESPVVYAEEEPSFPQRTLLKLVKRKDRLWY